MNDSSEQFARLRELLETAVENVEDMDVNSRDAFADAAKVLQGTSTSYGTILKKHANTANREMRQAIESLEKAIAQVDELRRRAESEEQR